MSRPKLDLTESKDGSIHHLTVHFSEFDITTYRTDIRFTDILQISQIFPNLICCMQSFVFRRLPTEDLPIVTSQDII